MNSTLKKIGAGVAGVVMALSLAACGQSAQEKDSQAAESNNTSSIPTFDVSSVKKDDAIAVLIPEDVAKSGELTVGMELSYAPAEFLDEDGSTPVGYDVDLSKALGAVLGLKTKVVSSTFDSIVPSVGSKYDLGITAMTITKERMKVVDFVSYYSAGSMWVVKTGNPNKVDTSDLCGTKIAVQVGTVQEEEANAAAEQCKADGKDAVEVLSSKLQTDAATNVITGKADVFYADSPVGGYAINQTGGQLEALGKVESVAKQGIALQKGNEAMGKAVQQAMQKLMDDGTYGKILSSWGVEAGALQTAELNPTDVE